MNLKTIQDHCRISNLYCEICTRTSVFYNTIKDHCLFYNLTISKVKPCRVGLVVSVSASHTVGRGFAPMSGHTKDHHKNGTDCLPA